MVVHEPPTVRLEPQVVLTNEKPLPVTLPAVGAVTLSGPTPVLVSVDVAVGVEPVAWLPKSMSVIVAD